MKPLIERETELTLCEPRSMVIKGLGKVTTPPSFLSPTETTAPVKSPRIETAAQKISRLLRNKEAETNLRLSEIASAPGRDLEFTTNLLVTQPFLAVAVSLSEGFANVIIPPSRRESETQRKLSQLSEASFHVRYRQLDIGNRICPEINLRVEILYDELQRVKQDFQQKLQNGTVQVVEDTIGKPRPIFVSTLDTEEASVELFTEFSRLAELEDIFGSNRFKSAVEKLYQRPQANLDYAKKQAYANRASVQAVVLAEKEGEIKASKYFVNKRVLESFDLT